VNGKPIDGPRIAMSVPSCSLQSTRSVASPRARFCSCRLWV